MAELQPIIVFQSRILSAILEFVIGYVLIIIIIIIIPDQFIKHRKWWFVPPHQGRFDILTMTGRECSRLDPTYQRHITFAMYRLLPTTPPSPSRHYYPRLIAGTNLPTLKGWIAWLAKTECMHIIFAQDYYTIESKDTGRKWTQVLSGPRPTQYQWANRAVHYNLVQLISGVITHNSVKKRSLYINKWLSYSQL